MSKTKAVLFWPETEQASIMDISYVREEDRFQDAPTVIKLGNKFHKAIVRLISSDLLKLQEVEDKVLAEIEEAIAKREKELGQLKRRQSRHRMPATQEGVASANQVASALGERLKPTPGQAAKSKELATAKRAATKAQNDAQDDVDKQTLSFRKELFPDSNPNTAEDDGSEEEQSDDGVDFIESEVADEQPKKMDTSKCCSHCKDLRKAYNQSGTLFVQALATFGSVAPMFKVQYAKLLPIPDDVPKCELTKFLHPKVYISNSDKASIKVNGEGDPSKLVRLTLTCLFGRENLEFNSVTALGTKPGTLGVTKNVRDAILGFANRNRASSFKELTEAQCNGVINKQKCQIHRKRILKEKQKEIKNVSPAKVGVSGSVAGSSKVIASPSKSAWVVNERTPSQAFRSPSSAFASPSGSPGNSSQNHGASLMAHQQKNQYQQHYFQQQQQQHLQPGSDYYMGTRQPGVAPDYQQFGCSPPYAPHQQQYTPGGSLQSGNFVPL